METEIMEAKFKTGDKVVRLELDYVDNPYHFKRCVTVLTVEVHDDKYFSPYSSRISHAGMDSGITFNQHGISFDNKSQLYHLIKDKKIIDKLISDAFLKYDDDREEEDRFRIEKLQSQIKEAEEEISEIQKGNSNFIIGFWKDNKNDFRHKVKSFINKSLE